MHRNDRDLYGSVILSEAKNPGVTSQILSEAKNDMTDLDCSYAYHVHCLLEVPAKEETTRWKVFTLQAQEK